ncbi:MAG: hypothetical protein ACJ79D_09160 [Myxococcales bacterium]
MIRKARVKAGPLVLDEPSDLPEGTEVPMLELLDIGGGPEVDDPAALEQALVDSEEDVKAGRLIDEEIALDELQ